jgi:two-component system chemotaxis response regulator CheB
MEPIKVLIVDDSVVIRRLLTAVLDAPDDIEVVGYSTNGKLALEKIAQLSPDIVSLDVMMPVMNGIECMTEIRKRFGDLPVIMFSSLTEEGASVTMEALDAGANDFITKPWKTDGFADSVGQVSEQLLERIRALAKRRPGPAPPAPLPKAAAPVTKPAPAAPRTKLSRGSQRAIEALVIGSSTGGPNALNEVFSQLPKDIQVPILIAQHMPPMFTKLLAERLAKRSGYVVREAVDGEQLAPGEVLVAPGDFHLRVRREGLAVVAVLDQEEPVHSCRPAVDPLFFSANRVWGGALLAVVLTGMGRDGADGAVEIAKSGGRVYAQDEATSVVWGMPGATVQAGAADKVLPLKDVAREIGLALSVNGRRATGGGVR